MVESISSGDVVDEECSDGTPVIRSSNGTKSLLSGRIPNLKFYVFVLDVDGFGAELNPDGDVVGVPVFAFDELEDDAGFADSGVADDDKLIKVMV